METTPVKNAPPVKPAAENRSKAPERAQAQDKPAAARAKEPDVKKSEERSEGSEDKTPRDTDDRHKIAEA